MPTPNTADAMKRHKAGKAGFTDIAHLKAKGLIKRADGTKRKSAKYEIKEEFRFFPDNMEEYIQIPPPPQDEQQEMATVRKFVSMILTDKRCRIGPPWQLKTRATDVPTNCRAI